MKKNLLYALALATSMVACTDDYTDWADPQQNAPEEAQSVAFAASPAAAIDFATVETESVQLFVPSVTAAEGATSTFSVVLYNADKSANSTMAADANGAVVAAELETIINSLYGRRPEARNVELSISAFTSINGQSIKSVASTTATITPEAPVIDTKYYITGGINNWDNTNTTYEVTNGGGDVYDNPIFTVTLTAEQVGEGFEFKLTPVSGVGGDWSGCITADTEGTEGKLASNNAGGNLKVEAVADAKFYKLTFNLLDQTWTCEALSFSEFIYVPGNHQGWNPATAPALRSPKFDGVYTGYVYMDGEFKFTKERNWDNGEYNSGSFTSTEGDLELGEPGSNINITRIGLHKVIVDIPAGKLTVIPTSWGIIGNALQEGWDMDTAGFVWNSEKRCLVAAIQATDGEIKFRANGGWEINLGGPVDDMVEDGGNIAVTAGTYDVDLYIERTDTDKMYCVLTKK